jgi:hypothetical protein
MLTNFNYSDYFKEQTNEILEEKTQLIKFKDFIRR